MNTILQHLHSRLGDFWWYSILMFVALRLGDVINAFIGLWLVPKYVSPDELGAVMPLMQFSAFLGFPMAVLMTVFSRYLTQFQAQGETGKIKSAIRWFIGAAIFANVFSCLFALFCMPMFFERIRVTEGSLGILIIVAGLTGSLSPIFNRALQGLKKFRACTLIGLLSAPVRLLTMIILLPIRALSGYMCGQIVPSLVAIGSSIFVLKPSMKKSVQAVHFWEGDIKGIIRYTLFILTSYAIGSIFPLVMPLVIRQRLPECESAAYYIITRFAELATYASTSLAFIMFPMVSEAHAKGKNPIMLLLNASAGTFGFGALSALVLYMFGHLILSYIPTCAPYASYSNDMALLALTLCIGFLSSHFTEYQFARNSFGFMFWSIPITLIQIIFTYVTTGYTFFSGVLSPEIINAISSLHMNSLRNLILSMMFFNVLRVIAASIHLLLCNYTLNPARNRRVA